MIVMFGLATVLGYLSSSAMYYIAVEIELEVLVEGGSQRDRGRRVCRCWCCCPW